MLDPVPPPGRGLLRRISGLHAGQHLLDRGVTDRVDGELPALLMIACQQAVHRGVGEAEHAGAALLVRHRHRRGQPTGRAIAEHLHRAEPQHCIAVHRPDAGLPRCFGDPLRIAGKADPRAHRQASAGMGGAVGIHLPHAGDHSDIGVHHGGEAQLVHMRAGALDRGHQRRVRRLRHAVAHQPHRALL